MAPTTFILQLAGLAEEYDRRDRTGPPISNLTMGRWGVEATIIESRLAELLTMALDIRWGSNIVAERRLRTFTGKAQSMASLLWVWRPLQPLSEKIP